jgi:hypothetical protein
VIGLGAEGALLALREEGRIERLPAVHTRPVASATGAAEGFLDASTLEQLHAKTTRAKS